MERGLRVLTALQHLLFVVLTVVCVARSAAAGVPVVPLLLVALALLLWYGAGALLSRRRRVHASEPAGAGRHLGVWWLLGLTAWWLLFVAISHENVWVAFGLWLLAGHFLPWRYAVPYTLLVLAVVVGLPWQATGRSSAAAVIGPTLGAAFALTVSRSQILLVRESQHRQRLVASLVRSQREAEALHGELAALQRDSGALGERARLSRDIHDTLAQGFSSIVLLARAGAASPDLERTHALLRQIDDTASENLAEARRVVGALAPAGGSGTGLTASVDRLLSGLAEETGLRTRLDVDGDLDGLPTTTEVALVRTAQGALANVRLHARAHEVRVTLTDAGDVVHLDVADDGVGFDPRHVGPPSPDTGGYGLRSTRARLRELGGGLEVRSAPGEGTVLSAHVPIGGGR